jgi:hypothetical protein
MHGLNGYPAFQKVQMETSRPDHFFVKKTVTPAQGSAFSLDAA